MKLFVFILISALFNIVYFPIFTLTWLFTTLFDKKGEIIGRMSVIYAKAIIYCSPWWRLRINGIENIDRSKKYIIMSNHQSMLDIPAISSLPLNIRWVAKKEVFNIPLLNVIILMRRDITIVRGALADSKRMLKKCRKEINMGKPIGIFPEGTRTKTGRVMSFKEGGFMIAKMNSADILPIVIEGSYDATHPKKGTLKFPATFYVNILEPIPNELVKELPIKELKQHTHRIIYNYHKALRPDLYETN